MGSSRRDAENADHFSTVGLQAAVDALENEPDISWQLGELLGVREEKEENDSNNSVYEREIGRVSSVGSLDHNVVQ